MAMLAEHTPQPASLIEVVGLYSSGQPVLVGYSTCG